MYVFPRCPGCRQNADPVSEFISKSQIGISKPKLKMFTLPVIVRQNANSAAEQIKGAINYGGENLILEKL